MYINQLTQVPPAGNQIIPVYDGNSSQPRAILVSDLATFVNTSDTNPLKLQYQLSLTAGVAQTITALLSNRYPCVDVWDVTNGNVMIRDNTITLTAPAPSASPAGELVQTMTISSTTTRTVIVTIVG